MSTRPREGSRAETCRKSLEKSKTEVSLKVKSWKAFPPLFPEGYEHSDAQALIADTLPFDGEEVLYYCAV